LERIGDIMDYIEAMQNLKSEKQKEKERREKEERTEYELIITRLINMNKRGRLKKTKSIYKPTH
jgi:hypothetical protein